MIITAPTMPGPDLPPYLRCVLELPGALVEWDLLDPPGSPPRMTILAIEECDWLWRLVTEAGHRAVIDAMPGLTTTDLPIPVDPTAAAALRRLAYGHWLRRWWPASAHGPVPVLDPVLVDLEVAVLTQRAEGWFAGDTLDSDPAALLARWPVAAVCARACDPTPGARDLLGFIGQYPDELVPHWTDADLAVLTAALAAPTRTRQDYALAAGGPGVAGASATGVIATGRTSVDWLAVPPGVLDAAEDTVTWQVEAAPGVEVAVRCEVLVGADASGTEVRLVLPPHLDLRSVLDAGGRVRVPVPIPATTAWQLPWEQLRCLVGVGPVDTIPAAGREPRETARRFVRRRLADPRREDLFVAERAAADLDY